MKEKSAACHLFHTSAFDLIPDAGTEWHNSHVSGAVDLSTMKRGHRTMNTNSKTDFLQFSRHFLFLILFLATAVRLSAYSLFTWPTRLTLGTSTLPDITQDKNQLRTISLPVGTDFRLSISGGQGIDFSSDNEYTYGFCGYGYPWLDCLEGVCCHGSSYGLDCGECRMENSSYLWYQVGDSAPVYDFMYSVFHSTMSPEKANDSTFLPGNYSITLGFHSAFCIHPVDRPEPGSCHQVVRYGDEATQVVQIVRVAGLQGPDGFSTSNVLSSEEDADCLPEETDFLSLPLGANNGRATFTALPYPSLPWPSNSPSWGIREGMASLAVSPEDRSSATIATDQAFSSQLELSCGSSYISLLLNVVEVDQFRTAVAPKDTDFTGFWDSNNEYGAFGYLYNQMAPELSGPENYRYLFLEAQDAWLTIFAQPNPSLGDTIEKNEQRLPAEWSFQGGEMLSPKLVRKLDLSVPGVTRFTAQCGTSQKQLTVLIGKLDLQVDSNGDGSIDENDDPVEMDSPGLVALANDGDADTDSIPDAEDPQIDGSSNLFSQVLITLANFPASDNLKFHFQYDAAPSVSSQSPEMYCAGGNLRLWKKQSNEPRNPLPLKEGGDFIAPNDGWEDEGYTAEELGLELSTASQTGSSIPCLNGNAVFWLEGTAPMRDGVIRVWTSSGEENSPRQCSAQDEIKVSFFSLQVNLRQAELTGGESIPEERKTTFGLPLVVNDDFDGLKTASRQCNYTPDCEDCVVNGRNDRKDLGHITLPALPDFLPDIGTAQLTFSGQGVKLFTEDYSFAGNGETGLGEDELYRLLKAGELSYHLEATTKGTVEVQLSLNHSPAKTVAVIRNFQATRELITHDPEFEKLASLRSDDNWKQRELMDNTALIALPSLPSVYAGKLQARILETTFFNEPMGAIPLNSSSSIELRLQQRFANDEKPDADNYHQVWLEAGSDGNFTPLLQDWSYPNSDILVEIYAENERLLKIPIHLKTLLSLPLFHARQKNNVVQPVSFDPYSTQCVIFFDYAKLWNIDETQYGYAFRLNYALSENVLPGNGTTGNSFFRVSDVNGDAGSHAPAIHESQLIDSNTILMFSTDSHFLKWEGYTSAISDENAYKIWNYPGEAAANGGLAAPAKVVKEGNYKLSLACHSQMYPSQSQSIQFETEVKYE